MSNVEATDMESLPEILTAFEQALELERELGTRAVDCDRALLAPVSLKRQDGRDLKDPKDPKDLKDPKDPKDPKDLKDPRDLKDLKGESRAMPTTEELAACTKCTLATLGRQHVVPGQGNAAAPDFMFIGEAPGADEDRQGLAFVGAAGQFLTKMIAAMGYTREQVFIANICKCRPPNNRTPSPPEMAACVPYLKRQIKLIRPKCLVLLGNTAMRGLFPDTLMRRGQWQMYEGIPAIGTFHPAYILRFDSARDPAGLRRAKLEVWNTLKLALARLGKTPPAIQKKG